jgi:hypothetical protein
MSRPAGWVENDTNVVNHLISCHTAVALPHRLDHVLADHVFDSLYKYFKFLFTRSVITKYTNSLKNACNT